MFVDERKIIISGGRGGDGIVHFKREKFIARGGPDGGNGGRGGDAYIEAVRDINYLSKYKEGEEIRATDGDNGKKNLSSGKGGVDVIVRVPVGTIITNTETLETFEFITDGEKKLVAIGGLGGLGNTHFKSSTNTTPKKATKGEEPQVYEFKLELHLIADVGIIGLPNAGKSTLLNTITNSNARVDAYPFTTLEPNLGVFHGYVIADIPGIIKNASSGKGLGYIFLRHISRTRVLVHLVSVENEDMLFAYKTIRDELKKYDKDLLNKKELIVVSKTDVISNDELLSKLKDLPSNDTTFSIYDDKSIENLKKNISILIQKI